MAKLERKALAHYIDASFGGESPEWFLVGKDIEDMSIDLGADISSTKNILGETSVTDNGYEPKISVSPYYANPSDGKFYEKIKAIALQRLKGDACKTKILEVIIEDTGATSHEAYTEDVVIKPTSYGGGTEGVAIPYDVYFDGNRQRGTVTITEGVPEFTKTSALTL